MADQIITYTLTLTITRPLWTEGTDDSPETQQAAADEMMGTKEKSRLELEVLRALKKLDGDCDCEVMECERGDA